MRQKRSAAIYSCSLALANSLRNSTTFVSSPIEWWFETTDTTIKALRLRVEDLFQFFAGDNELLQLVRQTYLTPKLRLAQAQVELRIQAYQKRCRMRYSMQQALSNSSKISQDDTLAQRILASILIQIIALPLPWSQLQPNNFGLFLGRINHRTQTCQPNQRLDPRTNGADSGAPRYHTGLGQCGGDSKGTGSPAELYATRSEIRSLTAAWLDVDSDAKTRITSSSSALLSTLRGKPSSNNIPPKHSGLIMTFT